MKIGNVEVYGIIYKITNKVNGKCYIGQTVNGFKRRYHYKGEGIERVYNYYKAYDSYGKFHNDYLLNSIEKYGFEAFDVVEVYDIAFSKTELDIKEKYYIKLFDCMNNGYNFNEGGSNGKPSESTRQKISEKAKGRKWSEEARRKMSESRKGINLWANKTEEEKAEWRKNSSLAHKGKCLKVDNPNSKSVVCLNTHVIFKTLEDAKEMYGLDSHLSDCCNGNILSCGKLKEKKLVWRYLKDYILMSKDDVNHAIEVANNKKNFPKAQSVMCITTKTIFLKMKDGAEYYNIDVSSLAKCCKGKQNCAGKLPDGTKLVWRYLTIIEL